MRGVAVFAVSRVVAPVLTDARGSTRAGIACAQAEFQFSPFEGMEVREILCKPRLLKLTWAPRYKGADPAGEMKRDADQNDG